MLKLFCVYFDPTDYPGQYVVREWVLGQYHAGFAPLPTPHAVGPTLHAVRATIPPGLACLPRDPADDPVIVEVWL